MKSNSDKKLVAEAIESIETLTDAYKKEFTGNLKRLIISNKTKQAMVEMFERMELNSDIELVVNNFDKYHEYMDYKDNNRYSEMTFRSFLNFI